ELAALIGGAVDCYRVATNAGWRAHSDQVGLTGTKITADLYIACGISGATQHWVGCMGAKTILAINNDPEAALVLRSDYAVIGDLHDVLRAVIDRARARQEIPDPAGAGATGPAAPGPSPPAGTAVPPAASPAPRSARAGMGARRLVVRVGLADPAPRGRRGHRDQPEYCSSSEEVEAPRVGDTSGGEHAGEQGTRDRAEPADTGSDPQRGASDSIRIGVCHVRVDEYLCGEHEHPGEEDDDVEQHAGRDSDAQQ